MRSIYSLAVVAALASMPAAAVNLVANGGFENPVLTPGNAVLLPGGSVNLPQWDIGGNGVAIIETGYSEPNLAFTAPEGSNMLDMTGAGNQFNGSITQTIATVAGRSYRLGFSAGTIRAAAATPNSGFFQGDSSLTYAATGLGSGTVTVSAPALDTIYWQSFSFTFVATGPTTLSFTNATTNNFFAGLDAVSLSAVPEPASWLMLVLGFGMAGSMIRRRRRQPA